MSYIGNSPAAGPTNKIDQGDSSVEVIDTGTGRIEFTTDGTKVAEIDASGDMKFDSGYGSAETVYGCRAWVNFNGTGTVAIRESGNVSSITDNATGEYTVNFANAMPDANYAASVVANQTCFPQVHQASSNTTSGVSIILVNFSGTGGIDKEQTHVAVFR